MQWKQAEVIREKSKVEEKASFSTGRYVQRVAKKIGEVNEPKNCSSAKLQY